METEEFDFSYILKAIKKWFLLICLFIILGSSAAIFYNYTAPIKYQSSATLYIQPQVNANEVDYQGILTNQRMVKTYAQIMKSRRVINRVIEELDLNLSYESFLGMVTINSQDDTQMISIVIKNEDKKLAPLMANTLAYTFIEEIKESMDVTNIAVIDEAIVNNNPVEPRKNFNLIIGIGLGAFIGLFLAFLIESMDNKIKTHEDVKKYLKLKVLGVIPLNSIDEEMIDKKKTYSKNTSGVNLKIINEPTSIISESIRMIRTNLNFMDLKLLNITSTIPSEGKSETIANLAISFAMLDKRVLIVDCDLRKPKIHRIFDVARRPGVSDVVLSKNVMNYKSATQRFEKNGTSIDILAAGSKISNPSELINSQSFANLLNKLKEDYDLVLIDCPPISSLTDGVLVSKIADGTVYIVESDRTDYQVIQSCIEQLQSNKAYLLGAILTKVNIKREKKLYGYKYDYYYSNYNK